MKIALFGSGVAAGSSGAFIEVFYTLRGIEMNGKLQEFPEKPFIYNGTVFVPVRAVAELLEKKVVWDENYRTITIQCGDNIQPYIQSREICLMNRNVILPEDVTVQGEYVGPGPSGLLLERGKERILIHQRSGLVLNKTEHADQAFSFLLSYIIEDVPE
ncbi:stalk domain-containing protein [Paenibacillus sp. y28]|uniref:stalk domain-containing protein n=1 Tax=Paenibacillus sp. y28 TaxID=3129110 RepID=UPI00301B3D09